MAARHAWVLNLDADLELGAPPGYTPTNRVRLAMKPHVEQLAALPSGGLLAPGDVLVTEETPPGFARGLVGRAFCPTPNAIRLLKRAGAIPEAHPPVDVLRRVNSRAFASALGPTLPGAVFVTDVDAARTILAGTPPVGEGWRIKHAFGMTGRNQRVVAAGMTGADAAFVATGVARGGVQIEPNVAIDVEYALHGLLSVDGALRVGSLVRQRCDARGAWIATERIDRATEPLGEVLLPMRDEVTKVAAALWAAGYFGPFGVDAYVYRDRAGAARLQPRSEINARYSMGFAIGIRDG